MHLFMMGDSVFDNAAYVRSGEPDVRQQVADLLGEGDQVTSAARDGAVIAGTAEQLGGRPPDASHIVVSAGGNDALQAASVLETRVSSMSDALEMLADVAENFRRQYAALLQQLASTRLPVGVCTIYDPRFPDARLRRAGTTALSVLNDAITREAFSRGFAAIDLRLVCDRDEDFANPIEPSAIGGAKIARAIVDFANGVEQSTTVFAHATRREPAR
jgi:GDSL-like Lipase/Acylhydrolase family